MDMASMSMGPVGIPQEPRAAERIAAAEKSGRGVPMGGIQGPGAVDVKPTSLNQMSPGAKLLPALSESAVPTPAKGPSECETWAGADVARPKRTRPMMDG
jgi:hypothetical protein